MKQVIEALPKELLKESFFMWLAGFFEGGTGEILAAFAKARAAAKKAGLDEMEAEIMVDTVLKLVQAKRTTEALVLVSEINLDLVKSKIRKNVILSLRDKK